jgi:hypothetical protein
MPDDLKVSYDDQANGLRGRAMMASVTGYYVEDGDGREIKHVVSPDFAKMVLATLDAADDANRNLVCKHCGDDDFIPREDY